MHFKTQANLSSASLDELRTPSKAKEKKLRVSVPPCSSLNYNKLTNPKIDIAIFKEDFTSVAAEQFVTNDESGGIVTFVGTVRKYTKGKEVIRLEFEAYEPMAIKEMYKIAETILADYPAERVAIHHRVGVLPIGGVAVVIAVACPHRKDAFSACQYAIDTLKESVPIWKKEIFTDGEVWVAAHP